MQIQDAGSVQGVCVDGAPVDSCEVAPGQIIHLGTFMIKVLGSDDGGTTAAVEHLESVPLEDGSYSCLTHQDQRASFECEHCFHLFCEGCLPKGTGHQAGACVCPVCGREAKAIDWSGLSMTSREAAMELVPDSVKTALSYWQKWKQFRDDKNVSGIKKKKD